jgi:pilus assembly protein FimV
MLRKLAIAIAASGAMMSATNVLALGMGDIELESALNQPLDARIKLLKASELENWEMKPNLASSDEFEKSGVEHVFFLNNLQFEIERSGGDVYVHVTTNQAVVEPFLNFLVQVDWPNGRLLREYTLLLDPPVFNEEPPVPVTPVQPEESKEDVAPDSMALPGTAPVETVQPQVEQTPVEKMTQKATPKPQPSTYKVRDNDTLWEVAIRTRGNRSISPQQAMLAIQDLNPKAFINGNINRLKKNQVLRVPDEQQMLSRTFDEAVAEVAIQNQAIAKRKAQLDATRKDAAMQRDAKLNGTQLKLVAGGEATTDNQRNASGQVAAKTAGDQSKLEKDLAVTLENLDKTTRENQELRSRLDSLEEQINTLQRLINLKDEQMVALQSGMAEKPVKAIDIEPAKPVEDSAKVMTTDEDLNFAAQEAAKKVESADQKIEQKTPKPKSFALDPVEEEFDPVAFVMENPPLIGAGLGALLLALFGVNYARKRKEKQQDEDIENSHINDAQDPLDDVDLGDDFNEDFSVDEQSTDLDLGDFNEDELSDLDGADSGLLGDAGSDLQDEGAKSEDVLGEVDVYMAYNRLEPARALLEKTITAQPARMDLRLKMVEVLSSMDDKTAMSEQVDFINANGTEEDKSALTQLESGEFDEGVNEDFAMDFGLDDDLGMSDVSTEVTENSTHDLSLNEGGSDLDFDLDGLELNDSNELSAELDLSADLDTDLDFDAVDDLDLDFSSETESEDLDIALSETNDDSNGMDFDLGDFETAADKEVVLDEIEEPTGELDQSLDALSLDQGDGDNGLEFNLDESNSDVSLDFELPEASADDIPELSASDELEGLSFESDDEDLSLDLDASLDNSDTELSLDGLDSSDDLELESLDGATNDSLPEFEEGLSFDEEEMELPELTDEIESNIDSELDALESDDIELPTLEADVTDLDELPELNDTFDLDVSSDEALEPVEDVVAEYKEELPSLDDTAEGDDFPPLGDIDDLDLENLDNDLDFLSGTDESETKLDLARAYIDMEDQDGAREILQEVLDEGSDEQKQEATKLMDSLV